MEQKCGSSETLSKAHPQMLAQVNFKGDLPRVLPSEMHVVTLL